MGEYSNRFGDYEKEILPPAEKSLRDRPRFGATIEICDSDWIDSIQYDTETLVLDAKLKTGDRYRYRDVHPMTFAYIVTASSSGKAFNEKLRSEKFTKLPAPRQPRT